MNTEPEENIFSTEEESYLSHEETEGFYHKDLDSRRRVERFFELRRLREQLEDPSMDDIF